MIAKGYVRIKAFAIMKSHENAASASTLSGNRKFQDPETSG